MSPVRPLAFAIKSRARAANRRCSCYHFAMIALLALAGCDRPAPTLVPPAPAPGTPVLGAGAFEVADARYVGRDSCVRCHEQEVRDWQGSNHDLAMQEASESTVLGDFADATFIYHGVTSTFFRRDGKFFVRTDGPDGALHEYEIAYTFGIYPLQQYLIRFPGGRVQALNVCWDTRSAREGGQRWFHLYPDENIAHDDILHWTGPYQNWNHMCAECHSTGVRKGYDPERQLFNTTWSEIDVSCETCHGPASRHVEWADASEAARSAFPGNMGLSVRLNDRPRAGWFPDPATGIAKRERPRTEHTEIQTCARCHARRGTFDEDHRPGRPLADTHRLALLDEALYEPDGQIKDEVYEHGSFIQSRMHAAGVTCTDCHHPHTLKVNLGNGGNDTCAKCHQSDKYDVPTHHRHKPGTEAARCVSCHAPTRNYMVVHARHDHSFRIPRPDLTLKTGAPNACNGCHADKPASWAADAAAAWWGERTARLPHFATALKSARRGKPGAQDLLLGLINEPAQPAIVRASALEGLTDPADPRALAAIGRAATDPDPQVRSAAARALRPLAPQPPVAFTTVLPPLLLDPVRQVRMDAARALAAAPALKLDPTHETPYRGALAEYIAAERLNADRAESRINLGVLALDQGDPAAAEREYLAGIAASPRFAPTYVNLADLYRTQNREKDSLDVLSRGLTAAPGDAGLRHALGLALVRQKQIPEAIDQLKRAADLAPDVARYAYVHAVALDSIGRRDEAVAGLERLLERHPADADTLSALAAYAAEAGRFDEALKYADRLVAATPNDPGAAQLRDQLRRRVAPPR